MKLACAALLLSCLPAFGQEADSPPPPELVADQKARRMYHWYLNGMMESPDYRGQNLTFRISNDILAGGNGEVPEFYLTALLHVKWVEIRYPERTSIYSALRRYFLENPTATLDQLRFSPATINKRITFEQCPELENSIYAIEQYIRTSLITSAPSEFTGLHYLVGYSRDNYDVTFQVSSPKARPVAELLEVREIAMRCARNLPTIEESDRADQLRRDQAQAELIRNFNGPILDSPPTITLRHGSKSYQSAIGTSCWGIGSDRFCDDVFASVTPRHPILVRRGERIHFDIPERGRLESMHFAIARVTDKHVRKREEDKEFKDIIIWEKELRERLMSETELDSVVIHKPSGRYILILHGAWADYGDAVHGFYLWVQ